MRNLFIFCSLFFGLVFFSCARDQTTVQIIHNPFMTFSLNGTSVWKADTYSFAPISRVVVYPKDTLLAGQLYNRFTIQSTGKDNLGNSYQLIITFDATDVNQLIGSYSPSYTSQMGLSQVQLFNLTNSNNLSAYNLCQDSVASAFFRVQNQSQAESLISGVFHMTLCNTRDTTLRMSITNGIFNNIKY